MRSQNHFVRTAGIIFGLVALTHLWIALTSSSISVDGTGLGMWISWLAFIVTGYMAIEALSLNKK
jgi:hypothetical protein